MTQASVDRLERIESIVEKMDRKLDAIATDIVAVKISQARTEKQLDALEEHMKEMKGRVQSQDNRLWGFVIILFLSLAGVLAKVVFFPQA